MIMKKIPIHPKTKALIFDCDGTLVDSMPLHMKSWEYAIHKFNAHFDYDFFFSRKGMKETDIIKIYNSQFNTNLNEKEILNAKHEFFLNNIHEIKPIKDVVDIVENYKNIFPMAVVSGGVKKIVNEELRIIGIDKYFDAVLTADDSIKPKPAPDMFLAASKIINVPAQFCQVFEDGDLGIEAALKAKMIVTDVREFIN